MFSLRLTLPLRAPTGALALLIRLVGILAVTSVSLAPAATHLPLAVRGPGASGASHTLVGREDIIPLLEAAEYQATPQGRADGRAAFWAPNRVNDLSLEFGPDGLLVRPWQDEGAWSLSLRAVAYGPAGAPLALSGAPALSAERERVEYRWPGLREWYSNGAAGLKHNLTLERPVAADRLQVDLALGGTLRPRVSADGQAVSLLDEAGGVVLDFGALYVYDATGRTLAARFGAPQEGGARLPLLVEAAGARFPITVDPLLSSPRPKLTASPVQSGGQFGFAVAADGEVLVVGAFSEDGFRTPNKGAAYVFTRNRGGADSWGQVRKLLPSDVRAGDNFGASVAVAGDVVVVGAPRHDALATNDGAAFVFERHQGGPDSWGLRKKLTPSGADAGDEFGFAVAASGAEVAVGAPNDDNAATDAGAITFFSRFAGPELSWGEVQTLRFADHAGARLGFALAMDGRTLVAGAPLTNAGAAEKGRVFVFKRDRSSAGRWQQDAFFSGGDSAAGDHFGRAVAINGETIVVGAPFHDVSGAADRGAAYLFSRGQGGVAPWVQTRKLLMSGGRAGDRFGEGVAVDGAITVVGAPRDDDEARGLADAGSISIYADGQLLAKLHAADRLAGDFFGFTVAVSGDLVAAGAPFGDAGATDSGAAFLFSLNSELWSQAKHLPGNSDNAPLELALDGDTLAITRSDAPDEAGRGSVYVLRRNVGGANQWGEVRKLSLPANVATPRTILFGASLELDGDTLAVGASRFSSSATDSGSIFIYERDRGGVDAWGLVRSIGPQGHSPFFGGSLALSGDTIAAGSAVGRGGAHLAGEVELFMRNHGGRDSWGRAGVLSISDAGLTPAEFDSFGTRIDLDGNTLVVGTRTGDLPSPSNGGTTHLFARAQDGIGWRHVKTLNPSLPLARVDQALALDGDTLAIGLMARDAFTSATEPGTVVIYGRHQGGAESWGEVRRVQPATATTAFAQHVALDGDTLAVADVLDPSRAARAGSVYLFERNVGGADAWGLVTRVTGSQSGVDDHFGSEPALDGNNLVVRTNGLDSVYVFRNAVRAPTGLGLQAATSAPRPGEPVTVTAAISGERGAPEGEDEAVALAVPQGEVSFYLNGEPVGTASLDAQGLASLTLPGLPQGAHELVARFEGNENWTACEAPPMILFVGVDPPPLEQGPATVFLPLVQR